MYEGLEREHTCDRLTLGHAELKWPPAVWEAGVSYVYHKQTE